ncbi:MAG: DUF4349 domain-containing protein [Clostridia bacterium]|nr:DUF4349 domain-containing protein [Clostridia bacterium]
MKKKALALLLALLLVIGLCACGASSASVSEDTVASGAAAPQEAGKNEAGEAEYSGIADAESPAELPDAADESGAPTSDKIIYSAYAEIETRDFDASIQGVYELIERFGGFLESSSVTGNDYYDTRSSRSAGFVIRIPSGRFEEMTNSLTELGNVPYSSTNADNITRQYNDTQSKLDAYEIEYDRLLSMLEKADTVEDMLAIEDRLADVRYNIQSLSNTISGWDSLLSYSTVSLQLTEVVEYTEEPVETETYWEEVGAAFSSTLKAVGRFFKGLFKAAVSLAPVLVILAVIAVAVLLVVRKVRKGRKAKSEPPKKAGESKGE